jgi:hypothetical protein
VLERERDGGTEDGDGETRSRVNAIISVRAFGRISLEAMTRSSAIHPIPSGTITAAMSHSQPPPATAGMKMLTAASPAARPRSSSEAF